MWKKLIILSLSVAVLLFLAAPITPATAGGKWKKNKKINWRVAGPIVDGSLILLKSIGSPGRADLTIMGHDIDWANSGPTAECSIMKISYKVNGV